MVPLFRAAWQMTTKPCITFPAPPLKFRTAGFPQYGFKAGLSDDAFLYQHSLPPSFVLAVAAHYSPLRVGADRSVKHHRSSESQSLYPRGPRSGAGYSVPYPHRLIGPIRPTCAHIEISPHGGLYPMPSLCAVRQPVRKWFRAFTARSFSACHPLRPRRARR